MRRCYFIDILLSVGFKRRRSSVEGRTQPGTCELLRELPNILTRKGSLVAERPCYSLALAQKVLRVEYHRYRRDAA